MLDEMPNRIFMEWLAFFAMRPFGPEIEDARAAVMPFVFSNAFKGRSGRSPRLEDFMFGDKTTTQKTPDQIYRTLVGWAKSMPDSAKFKRSR